MKNVRRISKDEGVSPVIATILMVAITVVLAAVLYVIVSGMMTSTTATKNVALVCQKAGTNATRCTIANADAAVNFQDIVVQIRDTNNAIVATWNAPVTFSGGVKAADTETSASILSAQITDNGDNKLGVGDEVYVVPANNASLVGYQVKMSGGGADGSANFP